MYNDGQFAIKEHQKDNSYNEGLTVKKSLGDLSMSQPDAHSQSCYAPSDQNTYRPQPTNIKNMFDNLGTLTTLTSNTNTVFSKNNNGLPSSRTKNLLQEINNLDKEIL